MASLMDGDTRKCILFQAKASEAVIQAAGLTAVLQSAGRRPAKSFQFLTLPSLTGSQGSRPVLFRVYLSPEELVSNEVSFTLSSAEGVVLKKTVKVDWSSTRNLFVMEARTEEAKKREFCIQNTAEEFANYLAFVSLEGWQEGLLEAAAPLWVNLKAPVEARAILQELNAKILSSKFTTLSPIARVFAAAVCGALGKDVADWPRPPDCLIAASTAYSVASALTALAHLYLPLMEACPLPVAELAMQAAGRTLASPSLSHIWTPVRSTCKRFPAYPSLLEGYLQESQKFPVPPELPIYCLYRLSDELAASVSLFISFQSQQLAFTMQRTVQGTDLRLYRCYAPRNFAQFSISLRQGDRVYSEKTEVERKVGRESSAAHFVFGLVFDMSFFRRLGSTAGVPQFELRTYWDLLASEPLFADLAKELIVQFQRKYAAVLLDKAVLWAAISDIPSRPSTISKDQLVYLLSICVSSFHLTPDTLLSLGNDWIRQLEGISKEALRLFEAFEPVKSFSGLMSLTVASVRERSAGWRAVFQLIEVKKWNKPLIAEAFAVLSTAQLQQLAESIEVMPLSAGFRFLKVLLKTKSASLSDCLRWLSLTLATQDSDLTVERATGLLDSALAPLLPVNNGANTTENDHLLLLAEVESAVRLAKSLPLSRRPVLVASEKLKYAILLCVQTSKLRLQSLSLFEVLFKDKTAEWLRPGVSIRSFTDRLFTEHSALFPFSLTYQALTPECGPALELLQMWLDSKQKNPEKPAVWLKAVDEQLCKLVLSAEELRQLAEETILRLALMETNKHQFLRLVTEYDIGSAELKQCYLQQAQLALRKEMETFGTLHDNELLDFLCELREKYPANEGLEGFISTVLSEVATPDSAIVDKLLISPTQQAYFPHILRLFTHLPTVQSARQHLRYFVSQLQSGDLEIETALSILESPSKVLICQALDTAIGAPPAVLTVLEQWRKQVEETRKQVKGLRDFIGMFFAELKDIHYFTQLANEWTGNYRPKLLKTAVLDPVTQDLVSLYLDSEAGYSKQLKCQAFAFFVTHGKSSFAGLSSSHMREVLKQADIALKNELADVVGNLQQMQLSRVWGLFSEVRELEEECRALADIFPKEALSVRKMPEAVALVKEIKLKKRICELLLNSEQLLAFKGTTLPQIRKFITAYNDRHIYTVTHFNAETQDLYKDLKYHTFSERMLETLEALVENKRTLEVYLREEKSVSELRKRAAEDDLVLEPETLREIETVREFVQSLIGLDTVFDLQKRLSTLLENKTYSNIEKLLASATQKIFHIMGNTDHSKQIISCIMKASTVSFFQDDQTRLQLVYSRNRTCDLRELEDLRAYSQVHATSRDRKEPYSFVDVERKLEALVSELEELEELGAPLPAVYRQVFKLQEGQAPALWELKQDLAVLAARWKDVLPAVLAAPEYYSLTFLPGRHLWEVESLLRTGEKSRQGEFWLAILGKEHDCDRSQLLVDSDPHIRLRNLNMSLTSLPDLPSPEPVPALDPFELEPVLYDSTDILCMEAAEACGGLLSLYQTTRAHFPKPDQLLFCQSSTRLCDLQAFLQHCNLSSEAKQLFTLVCPEFLTVKRQAWLRTLIEALAVRRDSGTLAVLYCDVKSPLMDFLKAFSGRRVRLLSNSNFIERPELLSQVAVRANPRFYVVSSSQAGLGKSTQITAHSSRVTTYVPLSGDLTVREIVAKLLEADFDLDQNLHLDLGYIENLGGLEQALCQLLLTGKVTAADLSFSLPSGSSVYVELGNVQSLKFPARIPLLAYAQQIHIAKLNFEELEVSNEEGLVYACLQAFSTDPKLLGRECPTPLLDPRAAEDLLQQYFLPFCEERGLPLSFRSIKTFTTLLGALIGSMYHDSFPAKLRPLLFSSLLLTAKEYLASASARNTQRQALSASSKAYSSSWELFNHDALILSPTKPCAVYKKLLQADINLRNAALLLERVQRGEGPEVSLVDYEQLSSQDLLIALCRMLGTAEDVQPEGYVLTVDNFLKMALISERAKFGLPIVIIGETGCGKTSLLRFLVEKVMKERLELVSIHAGTTAEELGTRMRTIEGSLQQCKRVWVFFDEFNTSLCLGSIAELLVRRSLEGRLLSSKLVFAAACNPYRLQRTSLRLTDGLKWAGNKPPLVHLVKVLPEAVLDHAWDFGALSEEDTRKYIVAILAAVELDQRNTFERIILEAHKYFRTHMDVSSVSLRDLSRFIKLYRWFFKSLSDREALKIPSAYYLANLKRLNKKEPMRKNLAFEAGLLAFQLCYTFRLSRTEDRHQFLQTVFAGDLAIPTMEAVVESEEVDIVARMSLPPSTAINAAVRENILVVFTCIYAKVPLLLCGKPGCSKTLATSLVLESCRGEFSLDPYFRQLPELTPVPAQGSPSLTSLSVTRVFDRTVSLQSIIKGLFVIIFEEIGLGELSPHNPLKVLHKAFDDNPDISFVGLSNWKLDASKQNRLLCLSRPEPSLEELKDTSLSLYRSFARSDSHYDGLIDALATGYCELRQHQRANDHEDFYGLRDFYALVKQVIEHLPLFDRGVAVQIAMAVRLVVQRNFGGLKGAAEFIWEKIKKAWPLIDLEDIAEVPVRTLITGNLEDSTARFLMIIASGEVTQYALETLINREVVRMTGSSFPLDKEEGPYGLRCINNLVKYLDRPVRLVLKDLEVIYSSLYDLFNQSYSQATMNRYVQIALGSSCNPKCKVSPEMRLVVLINAPDEAALRQLQAPFLNRFEKQPFAISQLLSAEEMLVAERVNTWVQTLTKPIDPFLSLAHVFPTYSIEAIQLRIRENNNKVRLNEDDIVRELKRELLAAASAEVLVLAQLQGDAEGTWIQQTWRDLHSRDFPAILTTLQESKANGIVFAYESTLTHPLPKSLAHSTTLTHLHNFKSEEDLSTAILDCFNAPSQPLFLLELDYVADNRHLGFVKSLIERLCMENKSSGCCLLLTLERNVRCPQFDNYFQGWQLFSVLSLSDSMELPTEVLQAGTKDLCLRPGFVDVDRGIEAMIWKALLLFQYQPRADLESWVNPHLFLLAENIVRHPKLLSALRTKAARWISQLPAPAQDWKEEIYSNGACVFSAKSLPEAIRLSLEGCYLTALSGLLFDLERKGALGCFFTDWNRLEGVEIRAIWLQAFEKEGIRAGLKLQPLAQSTLVPFHCILEFPFIRKDYALLMRLKEEKIVPHSSWLNTIQTYREGTVLGSFFSALSCNPRLETLYFRDLLRVHVHVLNSPAKYECWMYRLLQPLLAQVQGFEQRLWTLLAALDTLLHVCDTISAVEGFEAEVGEQAVASVAGHLDNYPDSTPIKRELLPELPADLPNSTVPSSPDPAPDLSSLLPQWKSSLGSSLFSLIHYVYPSFLVLKRVGAVGPYLAKVRGVQQLYRRAEVLEISIPSFDPLDFIVDLADVFHRANGELAKLTSLCKHIKPGVGQDFNPYDISELAYRKLNKHLEALYSADQEAVILFKAKFYAKWIRFQPDAIRLFALDLDSPNGLRNKLWRYAYSPVQSILLATDLQEIAAILLEALATGYIHLQESSHMQVLEGMMSSQASLRVLVCDRMKDELPHVPESQEALEAYGQAFHWSVQALTDFGHLTMVRKAILTAFLTWYLDLYVAMLVKEVDVAICRDIDTVLSGEGLVLTTLRLYVCKQLWQAGIHHDALVLFKVRHSSIIWLHSCPLVPSFPSDLPFTDIVPEPAAQFLNIRTLLREVMRGEELATLRAELSTTTPTQRISVGMALLTETMLEQWKNPQGAAKLNSLKPDIQAALGPVLGKLISLCIDKFPEGSLLRLDPGKSESDVHLAIALGAFLVTTAALHSTPSAFTSPFFSETPAFTSLYPLGVETPPLYSYLQDVAANFTLYSATKTYKCSDTCQYIYFIGNCGRPWTVSTCPYCKSSIGGTGHALIVRPGHREISSSDAITLAQSAVAKYLQTGQTPGYTEMGGVGIDTSSKALRGIHPFTYRLLHMLLNLQLHFLGLISPQAAAERVRLTGEQSVQSCVQKAVREDCHELLRMLNNPEAYLWLFRLIANLPTFLNKRPDLPSSPEGRRALETVFEAELVTPYLSNAAESIQHYKRALATHAQGNWTPLLEESVPATDYPLVEFFRVRRKPSEEMLGSALALLPDQSAFPALRVVLRHEEEIKLCRKLAPVLRLTNYLMEACNLKLAREEARSKKIQEYAAEDPVLAELLTDFLAAWEGVGELQYQCHQLDPLPLSAESELIYFLPDAREVGGGTYMAAAIETLAGKQNKVLTALEEVVGSGAVKGRCEAQSVPERGIFQSVALHSDLATCTTNPAYGLGMDLAFDFSALQTAVIAPLKNCYYLDTSSLKFVQYHLELFSLQGAESGLIATLRDHIGENRDVLSFNEWLKATMYREQKSKGERFGPYLRELIGELEILMCLIKSERISRSETIKSACERLAVTKHCPKLLEGLDLASVELRLVVSLYEELEELYFPFMTQYVQTKYKEEDRTGVVERTVDRVMNEAFSGTELPNVEDIERAMMKLIIRCLTADLRPTDSLSIYLPRPDFWPVETSFSLIENLQYRFEALPLCLSLATYSCVRKFNNSRLNSRVVT